MKSSLLSVFVCLVLSVLFSGTSTFAQGAHAGNFVREWSSGVVVLTTGDSVQGAITYHNKEDIINVTREDGTVSSFSPVNVHYFIVTDSFTGLKHVFRSLYWNQGNDKSDFKKPTFFEQLNRGKFTLIMRETFVIRNSNGLDGVGSSGSTYASRTLMNGTFADQARPDYFILLPDGEIKSLKRVRKDLFKLCGDKANDLKQFAKKKKLGFESPDELVTIVNYYNTL